MILEGLVTTLDADGAMHLAPMGPHVESADFERFELRPFSTSQTGRNLQRHGEGVLHVTDDALLLARAAIGAIEPPPESRPAARIRGRVLADCCRYFEFRVTSIDASQERLRMTANVVHAGRVRDFFGFHRARHAVVEAAILATRVGILPAEQIADEFARLRPLVDKTGGPREQQAFALLERHVAAARS